MLRSNVEAQLESCNIQKEQIEKEIKRVKAILQSMEHQLESLRFQRDYLETKISDLEDELSE